MIYLRALGLVFSDWLVAWCDGQKESIDFRGAVLLLRRLDEIEEAP